MKINRWIKVPLFIALLYSLVMIISDVIYGVPYNSKVFLIWLIGGALIGLFLLSTEWRMGKLSKNNAEDLFVIHNEKITMLMQRSLAIDFCKESLSDLNAKILTENEDDGFIIAKTKMNFHSFGTEISFKLNQIADNLTEVEIQTRPSVKTTLVDYGESLRIMQEITKYLNKKDTEINKKVLVDSAVILDDVYVKPFLKENVER